MAAIPTHQLALTFGLLGNILLFMVFLAPVPTFHRIIKKKSTDGFQSIPYSVVLFNVMLTLYYGLIKPNGFLLITINAVGSAIEATYLIIYMIYATKKSRIFTAKLIILFNMVVYGAILFLTTLLCEESKRITVIGWACAIVSVCVFAAPLSILKRVIETKSVEFMPFTLTFFLTISGSMWFFYGLLINDFFIALPNALGFLVGIVQMVLYAIYKNAKQPILPEHKLQGLAMKEKPSKPGIDVSNRTEGKKAAEEAKDKPSEVEEINV